MGTYYAVDLTATGQLVQDGPASPRCAAGAGGEDLTTFCRFTGLSTEMGALGVPGRGVVDLAGVSSVGMSLAWVRPLIKIMKLSGVS